MTPLRIARSRRRPVAGLAADERDAMFELMARYYSGVTREAFERDLGAKQHVICLYGEDRSLVGFSTIQLLHSEYGGRKVVTLFSGDTVIDERCWGQKQLQREFVRFLVRTRLRYPLRKFYWFLISKGYKTYLLMSNNFRMFPSYKGDTPGGARQVLDQVARMKYPDAYDAERNVIASCGQAVKDEAVDFSADDLENPHIRFFSERNPGWKRGDELCCLGDITFRSLLICVWKYGVLYPLLSLLGRNPRRRRSRPQPVVGSPDGGAA